MNNAKEHKQLGIKLIAEENLKIFFFPNTCNKIIISEKEQKYSNALSEKRKDLYLYSRTCMRNALSQVFSLKPIDIPLNAQPSKPPLLPKDYGFVSLSHCVDSIVVGWSRNNIGVDIERRDRKVKLNLISNKIFTSKEIKFFAGINGYKEKSIKFLEHWVIKESLIKREKDTISKSINKWNWDYNSEEAFNISKRKFVKVKKILYKDWIIGLACNSY